MRWWIAVVLAAAAGAVGLLVGLSVRSSSPASSMAGLGPLQLWEEQLRQQIRQLQISNDEDSSVQHKLLAWAPFVAGLGAIAAVGATLWKQASDLDSARTQLRDEHEKTRVADERSSREQEHQESLRRFDANLSMVISNLGSGSETLQVNAAAALAAYLNPRYTSFHGDLLVVLAANLRLQPTPSVARVLRTDLERLLRLMFGNPSAYVGDLPREVDLSRASLQRFDVSAVDFGGVVLDVAFADLSGARLVSANLFRLRGREVRLERAYCSRALLQEARLDGAHCRGVVMHNANLISASMKNADLSRAQFQEALMQEAHLEGANLRGADFNKANLANTYFRGAQFDQRALRSIALGALRWRENANFDDTTKQALEQEALSRGAP